MILEKMVKLLSTGTDLGCWLTYNEASMKISSASKVEDVPLVTKESER